MQIVEKLDGRESRGFNISLKNYLLLTYYFAMQ